MELQEQISQSTPVEPQPVSQSSSKKLKILFLVILLLLLSVLLIYGHQIFKQRKQADTIVPPIELTPTHTVVKMIELKTYTNEKYGFEFKYPMGYNVAITPVVDDQFFLTIVSEVDTDESGFVPIQFMINAARDDRGNPLRLSSLKQAETYYSNSFTSTSLVREDVTIDSKPAVTISGLTKGPGPAEGNFLSYTIVKLDKEVLVIQLGDKNYQNVFDQIVSSFRFEKDSGVVSSKIIIPMDEIYRYGKYNKYSIELPTMCNVEKNDAGDIDSHPGIECQYDSFRFTIFPNQVGRGSSPEEYVGSSTVKLNGITWNKHIYSYSGTSVIYEIGNWGFLVEVIYRDYSPEAEAKFESVLSSFQFLE